MKSGSILPVTIIGVLLLISVSTFGQTTQDKIQGTWKVYKYEIGKAFKDSENLISEVVGTIFTFKNCDLTIITKENGVTKKSGEYTLIENKLTISAGQPASEIVLLSDNELQIKLPFQQGILFFSKN